MTDVLLLFANRRHLGWNALVKFGRLVGLVVDGKRSIYTTLEEVIEDSNNRMIPDIQIKGTVKLSGPEEKI